MEIHGNLDEAALFGLHGWAHCETLPSMRVTLDAVINRRIVARIPAAIFRDDLAAARAGDGWKAFWFNPMDFLKDGENIIELYISGTDQLLPGGRLVLRGLAGRDQLKERAEIRWLTDEPDASLTWGNLMSGDSFIDQAERLAAFKPGARLLEIGPGYGRLLRTVLQRNLPFAQYLGIELAEHRTAKLRRQFANAPREIRFVTGNCDSFAFPPDFDLVFSSGTFEHLFPSMEQALANAWAALRSGGVALIDFVSNDEGLFTSKSSFEDDGRGSYVRVYSREELIRYFETCGFRIVEVVYPLFLGWDVGGAHIKRALVVAAKD